MEQFTQKMSIHSLFTHPHTSFIVHKTFLAPDSFSGVIQVRRSQTELKKCYLHPF